MYDKIKVLFNNTTYRYFIIGGIGLVICLCLGYIFYQPSGTDYQRPLTQWNELKKNNEKALSLIEASSLPLTEAQSLVMKQQQELIEARNTIDKLTTTLMTAKEVSLKQKIALNEMQNSLTELKEKVEKDNRTIKRLKMQRNLSQMVGAGAIIGVVIHR